MFRITKQIYKTLLCEMLKANEFWSHFPAWTCEDGRIPLLLHSGQKLLIDSPFTTNSHYCEASAVPNRINQWKLNSSECQIDWNPPVLAE